MVNVGEVAAWVEARYPPRLAESWDAIGLVCGRPESPVTNILVTVDVTEDVVIEAIETGADFVLAHHPLLLGGVTGIAATDYKGRLLHQLIENGCALMTAHTNADAANPGVSDALAAAIGLRNLRPLDPAPTEPVDKLVVFVPGEQSAQLIDALSAAGAGGIGDYDRCAYLVEGTGTFRPNEGANPRIGRVGEITQVKELRVEMVFARGKREQVVAALRANHPYEEPAFDIAETALLATSAGLGRIGDLAESMTLHEFAAQVELSLPRTGQGVRFAGNPDNSIATVAVCGGSGDSFLDAANTAGVDAYVTADLKHHRTSEHIEDGGCALINVAHWASEFPWCEQAAGELAVALNSGGATVSANVSRIVTDPWVIS